MYLSKYGVARHIYIAIPKAGSANHAVGADWTPAAGDVKISKDGGAAANVTNLPTAIAMGNSALWDFSLTATELQAAQVVITVADTATKAVDDTGFSIETYGNASGQHEFDLDTASVAQTGDNYARIGATGSGLTSLAPSSTALSTAQWTNTRAGYLDNLSAGAAALQSTLTTVAGYIDTEVQTLLDRIGGFTGSGVNTILGAFKALLSKTASTPSDIGGTFDPATDSTEALRDRGDAAWTTATGFPSSSDYTPTRAAKLDNLDATVGSRLASASYTAPLDASGTRSALGLASANLDTQLDAIPTNSDLATALAAADDAVLSAIAALNNLSSAQAQTAAAAALAAYDPPTNAEMEARTFTASIIAKLTAHAGGVLTGVVGSGSTTTSLVLNSSTGINATTPSSTNDFYNGRVIVFLTGALAGQATDITDYVGATVTMTITAVTGAPQAGDTFIVV